MTTLAEGVRQIRDGNLDHRIAHAQRDEFQPVCEAFNEMADRLRASVEQSQHKEEGRKELLASISHDVRSPLTSIRAYVEGLRTDSLWMFKDGIPIGSLIFFPNGLRVSQVLSIVMAVAFSIVLLVRFVKRRKNRLKILV